MKKFILLAVAAVALTMVSCNGNSDKDASKVDSLATLWGQMYGYGVAGEAKQDSTFNKADFLRGLEAVMSVDQNNKSYVQGMQLGLQLVGQLQQVKEQQGLDISTKKWLAAFRKAFKDDSIKDPNSFQMDLMRLMNEATAEAKENSPEAKANKEAGAKFIEQTLKSDKSVKKTASGLCYKVIEQGEGNNFQLTDKVQVIYKGMKIDGSVFDDSKGQAITFPIQGVIKGFAEGLCLMKPGAHFVLYIPGELAYGPEGSQGAIGPNETLVFDVTTVGLAPEEETAAADGGK